MRVVITDLDGTLLEHSTYAFRAALPALRELERADVPLVFCTSKTRAETEMWRRLIGNRHPFIVENGGAVYIPVGYFADPIPAADGVEQYDVLTLGSRYSEVIEALEKASRESQCRVRGFAGMRPEEVAAECEMSVELARLAATREYDEPFRVLDVDRTAQLLAAIERQGMRWTRGGRFFHILGNSDKGQAARMLLDLYRRKSDVVASVGLGDGLNDAPFLNVVDLPILIRSPALAALQVAVPRGRPSEFEGPQGWNEAILSYLAQRLPP